MNYRQGSASNEISLQQVERLDIMEKRLSILINRG